MILLTPVESETILLEKGIFISTEMGKAIADELKSGKLKFNAEFVPVHLPYEGLFRLDLGRHDHLKVEKTVWEKHGLPPQYEGENLNGKKLVVFPMHGLGDQLYLAVALRALAQRYPDMGVAIVSSSISSAEQWYPHIYFDTFYTMVGPVVTTVQLKTFDYYLNAEHFAHMDDYKGTYPPVFYMNHFFHHAMAEGEISSPQIGPITQGGCPNGEKIADTFKAMKADGYPLIFLSSVSTGRVRDLPLKTVLRFIECVCNRYAILVSSFKRPDIDDAVKTLNLPHVQTTHSLISHVNDLIEILRTADGVITTDSGITHLCEALETPCGTVFNVVSSEERVGPYRFSEALEVEFHLDGICQAPCYVHALKDGSLCPGMAHINDIIGGQEFYDYAPCMDGLDGTHLEMLLNALESRFMIR